MNPDRIHAYLDGELALDDLAPAERARAAELEAAVGRLAVPLRAAPAPDFTAAVMAALPAPAPAARTAAATPLQAVLAWLWQPRPLRLTLRPAHALAGAGFAALAAVVLPRLDGGPPLPTAAPVVVRAPAPGSPPPVYVQFRLEAPGAREVRLAGTFTEWQPSYALRQTAPGEWTALVPLLPGVHDYAYVIDGDTWVADPHAPRVDDGFGGNNSRISLPPLVNHT